MQKLIDAKEELERLYGVKVLPLQADISASADNRATVASVVEQTVKEFGGIDVLINNAQASASGVSLVDHTTEQFDLAIYSGLYSTFYYMQACYPYLAKAKGSVINFASGAGLSGKVGQSSYAAAKEGIRGMTRSTANEWGQYNINCNVVCPLVMTDKLAQWKEEYPEVYAKTIQGVPLGRFGDAEKDIGRLCVFLASEDASFITGETITIQGGVGMRP